MTNNNNTERIESKKSDMVKIETSKTEAAKIGTSKEESVRIETQKDSRARIEMKEQGDGEKKSVLFVTSEAQPFVGTGGLGEVCGSLPVELANCGNLDVRVVLPLYRGIEEKYRGNMTFVKWFYVLLGWRSQYCGVFELKMNGVTFYFIDNEYYFDRDGIYGYYDDGERYGFFCRSVMEMFKELNYWPDIVHANDWQSALIPIYNMSIYHYGFKSVFTIHNIAYQGKFGMSIISDVFGLPEESVGLVEYQGCVNLIKGAIESSSIVTTVSPTYAKELEDPNYAEGLADVIRWNASKMRGILNGISTVSYNPAVDRSLNALYSAKDSSGKAENKRRLQEYIGLNIDSDSPLIAIVSRLVYHKGIGMVEEVMESLVQENVQLIVLGVGDVEYENYFKWLESQYPGKVSINLKFDNALSRRIYAGADIFLMPSVSEPCGLSQMIACRYGAVPVVRETGGLKDSIRDYSTGEGYGFTFSGLDAASMKDALNRAIDLYHKNDEWKALVEHIMSLDFSWERSAVDYENVYRELIQF